MGQYVNRRGAVRLVRRLGQGFLRWFFFRLCQMQVTGLEHVPVTGPFLLVANHRSHADTGALFAAMPPTIRQRLVAAAAQDFFFGGGLRQLTTRALFNVIPVIRHPAPDEEPLRHVLRALREGYGVLFFPEGTRGSGPDVGPFKRGLGRLLLEHPALPVIPVWIEGTVHVLPKGRIVPRLHRVSITLGRALPPPELDLEEHENWRLLAEQMRAAVLALAPEVHT